MPHDVFISYSSKNKEVADLVCAAIEARGIRCWIAPRDITPGMEWSEVIIGAISECRIMVLIFSSEANQSPQVKREAERAVNKGAILLPVRIEDVYPSGAMEYYLSTSHWLDAVQPSVQHHLEHLAKTVEMLLAGEEQETPVVSPGMPGGAPRGARVFQADEMPEDIGNFNWGAFLLNRGWLRGHHVETGFWMGLLLSMPLAGLLLWLIFGAEMARFSFVLGLGAIGWIWLGMKGNQMAWQNRAWIDAKHFRSVEKGWMMRGLGYWAVVALLSVVFVHSGLNRPVARQISNLTAKVMRTPVVNKLRKEVKSGAGAAKGKSKVSGKAKSEH